MYKPSLSLLSFNFSNMKTVAVIPGTGNMGFGFSRLFAKAGYTVLLCSRDGVKARDAAAKIVAEFPKANVRAGRKEDLPINDAEYVVWTPQASIKGGLDLIKTFNLNGKIIIDTTNIVYKALDENEILGKTSSTEFNAKACPGGRWVAGFKTVGAQELSSSSPQNKAELYSDDAEALTKAKELVEGAGYPVGKTGPLVGAREAEAKLWEFIKPMMTDEIKKQYL